MSRCCADIEVDSQNGRSTITKSYFHYPLRIVSVPQRSKSSNKVNTCQSVYIVTYGGGFVAGDQINLRLNILNGASLQVLSQASTKIFKERKIRLNQNPLQCEQCQVSPMKSDQTAQTITAVLHQSSLLMYLPEVISPFKDSQFLQYQKVVLNTSYFDSDTVDGLNSISWFKFPSLIWLDWMSSGRYETGESWEFQKIENTTSIHLDSADSIPIFKESYQITKDSNVFLRNDINVFGLIILIGPKFQSTIDTQTRTIDKYKIFKQYKSEQSNLKLLSLSKISIPRRCKINIDGSSWDNSQIGIAIKFAAKDVYVARQWIIKHILKDIENISNGQNLFRRQL